MARPRQFDETTILAAVRDEFAKKGYEATSLDDLMRVTGLGKGSLYGAFGSKRELFLSALQLYCENTLQGMHDALSRERPALQKLQGLFHVSDPAQGSTKCYRGCFLANSTTELAAHDHDVRAMARRTYGTIERMLIDIVTQAQDSGDLPKSLDSSAFSRLLLTIMQGMEFLRKSGMNPEEIRIIARAAEASLLQPGGGFTEPPQRRRARKPTSAVKAARSKKRQAKHEKT